MTQQEKHEREMVFELLGSTLEQNRIIGVMQAERLEIDIENIKKTIKMLLNINKAPGSRWYKEKANKTEVLLKYAAETQEITLGKYTLERFAGNCSYRDILKTREVLNLFFRYFKNIKSIKMYDHISPQIDLYVSKFCKEKGLRFIMPPPHTF